MSSHEDHGHGHGGHHEHVEDATKPYIVAAVIIIAFCAGAYFLTQAGTAARAATHGEVGHGAGQAATTGHAGHGHAGHDHAGHGHAGHDHAGDDHAGHAHAGGAAAAQPGSDRERFVATFDERQRKLGFTLRAKAAGADQQTFEVRWDGAPEPGKIEALKNAAQLHVEARSRGFKKIAIVVNGKTVWEKAL